MKHGSGNRRSRNRGGSRRSNQNKTQVFDSNGPEVRIRGTAHQVFEKYMALSKDARGVGDHILAESYMQHAEHYQRLISGWHDILEEEQFGDFDDSYDEYGSEKRVHETKRRTPVKQQKSEENLQNA